MTEYKSKDEIGNDLSAWTYLSGNRDFKDMITMEYIYDLIYGDLSRIDIIDETTNILDLNKIPNGVFTLMVDDFWDICINLDNKQRYHVKRKVLKLVRRAIADYNAIACSLIGTDKIIILLDLSDVSEDLIENYLLDIGNGIREFIKANSIYTVTLGMGNIYDDYRNLWRAYEESFQAINYSFSLGKDIIVQYKDIEDRDKGILNYDLTYFEFQLFKNLAINDTRVILDFYDNLFNTFVNERYDRDSIKSVINKFIFDIIQYCRDLGLSSDITSPISMEASTQVLRASSITSIREVGREFLRKISINILDFTRDNTDLSLEVAIIFIKKYYNKDISLNDVAYVANMSDSYFSRKFKQRYGINFVNYVLDIRLEKACELLKKSNLGLREVAEKVGFNDLAYFSKSFKRKYGMSPSNYRSSL